MHMEIAEISCLACGRGLGSIQRRDGKARHEPPRDSPNTAPLTQTRNGSLGCARCGGKAFIGPFERVPTYAMIGALGAAA